MSVLSLIVMVIEALVMLFQLRALMQSSSVDFYHPVTQVVFKLTQPVIRLIPIKNANIKGFYYCGMIVSFVIALICVSILVVTILQFDSRLVLLFTTIITVKTFGYLIIILLLAQALTSWLPSTRQWSIFFSQITYPIVAPVQKIIPPIGMIDISLMIVMLGLFALDSLFARLIPIWRLF